MHIYIWWWPADERPRQPLIGQRLHFLFVELALISKDLASAAAVPGASNDLAPNPREPRVVQELFQLMEGRAHAADAFSRAVAFCTRMTPERPFFEAPLDLTAVQVCAQGLIARDYGAPRGILVSHLFQFQRTTVQQICGCIAGNVSVPAAGRNIGGCRVQPIRSPGSG